MADSAPRHHGLVGGNHIEAYCGTSTQRISGHRFGRMFTLPPLYNPPEALRALGHQGGPMKKPAQRPKRTERVPAGLVILGQFIDHDITFDITTSLERSDIEGAPNERTPTLDLDCVYGQGPEADPFLYGGDHEDGRIPSVTLLTGADGTAVDQETPVRINDLVRAPNGRAVIGDPRNDENRLISQMQLDFIRVHNTIARRLEHDTELGEQALFAETRRITTWLYQWIVLHEFLPTMCGKAVVEDILANGRMFFCGDEPYIPVEFSVAAYRFGHAMVPNAVRVQDGGDTHPLFSRPEEEPSALGPAFSPLPSDAAIVDWTMLLGRSAQRADRLAPTMAPLLLNLPFVAEGEKSLATRNLLRGQSLRLPSGEQVRDHMGDKLGEDWLAAATFDVAPSLKDVELGAGTPLWFYILAEADTIGRDDGGEETMPGEGLGPVGARIVAETLIGLMELDPRSFLYANRNWSPGDEEDLLGENAAPENLLEFLTLQLPLD